MANTCGKHHVTEHVGTIRPRWSAVGGLVFLLLPMVVAAQVCETYPLARPSLGVGTYHCRGGICRVWGAAAVASTAPSEHRVRIQVDLARGERRTYDFSVEPSLWNIDPDGPGADVLRDGDVLLAVNGYSVVSGRGTDELSGLEVGTPVTLTLRRREKILDVEVVPEWTCRGVRVSAGRGSAPGVSRSGLGRGSAVGRAAATSRSPSAAPSRHGTLGFAIGCSECRRSVDLGTGAVRWSFDQYPVIVSISESGPADLAGLRIGDVLTHIDGLDLKTDTGGERLGGLRGGETVDFRYRRGDSRGTANVTVEVLQER